MTILSKIEEAKRFFGVVDYPGNLFDILNTDGMIEKNRLLIFKQDIDKLSGFIGYKNGLTMICINYKRNIGHQNFTLAHELGHMFLHPGINMTDANPESARGFKENEANAFASEFVYPKKRAKQDFAIAQERNLFNKENWDELAEYVNELCVKYCISFKFAFYKLTEEYFGSYKDKSKYYKQFKQYVGVFRNRFPGYIHEVDLSHQYYKKMTFSYEYMKNLVYELIEKEEIGLETGEAILERYRELEY